MSAVNRTIAMLDQQAGNYGYESNYGAATPQLPAMNAQQSIAQRTQGASTFIVTVSCARTGTGSGNTYNPIYLFGGDAFTNASKGYLAVHNDGQVTATAVSNGKNVITFKYSASAENYATYTVSLQSDGEYPFALNALGKSAPKMVVGVQMEISDVTKTQQLKLGMSAFEVTEFGKSSTNDLSTPKDLYQNQDDGVFFPHQFPVSGRQGMITNVLDVDGFTVTYYFYIKNA